MKRVDRARLGAAAAVGEDHPEVEQQIGGGRSRSACCQASIAAAGSRPTTAAPAPATRRHGPGRRPPHGETHRPRHPAGAPPARRAPGWSRSLPRSGRAAAAPETSRAPRPASPSGVDDAEIVEDLRVLIAGRARAPNGGGGREVAGALNRRAELGQDFWRRRLCAGAARAARPRRRRAGRHHHGRGAGAGRQEVRAPCTSARNAPAPRRPPGAEGLERGVEPLVEGDEPLGIVRLAVMPARRGSRRRRVAERPQRAAASSSTPPVAARSRPDAACASACLITSRRRCHDRRGCALARIGAEVEQLGQRRLDVLPVADTTPVSGAQPRVRFASSASERPVAAGTTTTDRPSRSAAAPRPRDPGSSAGDRRARPGRRRRRGRRARRSG